MPMFTKGKSKGERFEKQMAPLFQFKRAFILDAPIEFLKHFEDEWLQFPEGIHDDCLDAGFWALDVAKHNLYGIPDAASMGVTNPMYKVPTNRKNPALLFERR